MAEQTSLRRLADGKIYHFNVIYNYARCPMSVTPDTELALKFAERVVLTLQNLGFVNNYYHDRDCLPGRNVFQELFRVVEGSEYTIIVLTVKFVEDCWNRYQQMATFKKLVDDGQSRTFIPISVGVSASNLPQELNTEHVLFFREDWEHDDRAWSRMKRVFDERLPVSVVDPFGGVSVHEPTQETVGPEDAVGDVFDGDGVVQNTVDNEGRGIQPDDLQPEELTNQLPMVSDNQVPPMDRNSPNSAVDDDGRRSSNSNQRFQTEDGTQTGNNQRDGMTYPSEPDQSRDNVQDTLPSAEHTNFTSGTATRDDMNRVSSMEAGRAHGIDNPGREYEDVSVDLQRGLTLQNSSLDLDNVTNQQRQESASAGRLATHESQLEETDLVADGENIEDSVVNRLTRTGIGSFRQDLYESRRKSVGDKTMQADDSIDQTRRKSLFDRPSQVRSVESGLGERRNVSCGDQGGSPATSQDVNNAGRDSTFSTGLGVSSSSDEQEPDDVLYRHSLPTISDSGIHSSLESIINENQNLSSVGLNNANDGNSNAIPPCSTRVVREDSHGQPLLDRPSSSSSSTPSVRSSEACINEPTNCQSGKSHNSTKETEFSSERNNEKYRNQKPGISAERKTSLGKQSTTETMNFTPNSDTAAWKTNLKSNHNNPVSSDDVGQSHQKDSCSPRESKRSDTLKEESNSNRDEAAEQNGSGGHSMKSRLFPFVKLLFHMSSRAEQPFYV